MENITGLQTAPDYNTAGEMLMQMQETRVGNIGLLAALSVLILTLYIHYSSEDNTLHQLSIIAFIFTELFFLATLKFLLL